MHLNDLRALLSRFHIRPDQRLGQNFLLSEDALDSIIQAAELTSSDRVLEIGPGLGVLTRRLLVAAGEVIAVEKDRKLFRALKTLFRKNKNLLLINDDALFLELKTHNLRLATYKLVANLPYYLTGKILQNFLTRSPKPSLMVLLLQKEVAERLTAKPGEMSLLSLSVQFYADPEIVAAVGKENFYPMPEVDSEIVRLRLLAQPRLAVDEKKFFQLLKLGFANKRKQLQNNLQTLGRKDYRPILAELGLNPLARAQDLSLEEWGRLYEKLKVESEK